MMQANTSSQARNLLRDQKWVENILQFRLEILQKHPLLRNTSENNGILGEEDLFRLFPPQSPEKEHSPYGSFLLYHQLSPADRLILFLALIPHFAPNFFSRWILQNKVDALPGNPFALLKIPSLQVFRASGLTALYLLEGENPAARLEKGTFLFSKPSKLAQVVFLSSATTGDPLFSGPLLLRNNWAELLLLGQPGAEQDSVRKV